MLKFIIHMTQPKPTRSEKFTNSARTKLDSAATYHHAPKYHAQRLEVCPERLKVCPEAVMQGRL